MAFKEEKQAKKEREHCRLAEACKDYSQHELESDSEK